MTPCADARSDTRSCMHARYVTDYPIDGYLHSRRSPGVALRRDKGFNLRPLVEAVGWVLAGATVGSVAVMLGAWGIAKLTDPPHHSAPPSVTAMTYQPPAIASP
jgi:hypothetical protein